MNAAEKDDFAPKGQSAILAELYRLREKIDVIERLDWIKACLWKLDRDARFIDTIRNRRYKSEIEHIMGLPFYKAKGAYLRLLDDRNKICHRYTLFKLMS